MDESGDLPLSEVKAMAEKTCLVLHRKSANEPAVKEAVRHVRGKGIKLRVRIPWNKKRRSRRDGEGSGPASRVGCARASTRFETEKRQ